MRKDKAQALKLRLQGKSYNEIAGALKIPKSTLSVWFKDVVLSTSASERLSSRVKAGSLKGLLKKNRLQTLQANRRARTIREQSFKEVGSLSKRELMLVGTALYWGEGYKRPIMRNGVARSYHPVSLSNSDPKLVTIFLRFLREICEVEESRITAGLRIYQHQNAQQLLQFWAKTTKIPQGRFDKFYFGVSKSSQGKRPFNILPYGTLQIRVNDTALFHKIMGWLEGISV